MKTALYLRVSTADQSLEPQRLELAELCARRGWANPVEYSDTISGAKFTRSGLESLMVEVRKGRVARVLCVKIDRLGRSLAHLAGLYAEFAASGVALICPGSGIDTSSDSPAGRFQAQVLMAVAEFERELIRERTKAGLAVARAKGKRLGRAPLKLNAIQRATLAAYHAQPYGVKNLATALGVSVGSAHRLSKITP